MSAPATRGRSDASEEMEGPRPTDWPPRTALGYIDAMAEGLALLAFTAVIMVTLLQVLARYVLHVSLPWTEELARILFVMSMMVGIALATRRGEHITVDFLFVRLSPRGKAMVSAAFDVSVLVLLVVWLRGAILLIGVNANATFVTMPWLKVAYVYTVEAAAIVLMMVFIIADMRGQIGLVRASARGV